MQLEGASEASTLDFSNSLAIFAFCKQMYQALAKCDENEQCTRDEDRRSIQFMHKLFQRFSLLYFYGHKLATEANSFAKRVEETEKVIEDYKIAMAAQEGMRAELKEILVAEMTKLNDKVGDLERRQMQLSAELVH